VKNVTIVNGSEVEVKPFIVDDFMDRKKVNIRQNTVGKKEINRLAKEIGLDPTEDQIDFAKKIISAYLAQK